MTIFWKKKIFLYGGFLAPGAELKKYIYLLSGALAALLFTGVKPFVQFWLRTLLETILWNYFEFGPVVQEKLSLKDIIYLKLWQLHCLVEQNHWCNFGRRHHEEQEEMSFKGICYLELWRPFCSAEWNHLCNFGRRHHKEQFCEIILNLDRCFRKKCHLKIFLIWRPGGPFYSGVEPFVKSW